MLLLVHLYDTRSPSSTGSSPHALVGLAEGWTLKNPLRDSPCAQAQCLKQAVACWESTSCFPLTPDFPSLSEPARSTRLILEVTYFSSDKVREWAYKTSKQMLDITGRSFWQSRCPGLGRPSRVLQRAHAHLHIDGENAVWPGWVFVHCVRGYNPVGLSLKRRGNIDSILKN